MNNPLLTVEGLSSADVWDFENGYYWFSDPTRLAMALSHYELYKAIVDVPGDVLEFGVYKGASLIRTATFSRILENDHARKIIVFDAFGSFPHSDRNIDSDRSFIQGFELDVGDGLSVEKLSAILEEKRFENIELIEGDVLNTLSKYLKGFSHTRIAYLHLDFDVFAPTEYVLGKLFERVVPGGVIVLDDYNTVEGETIAVDSFIANHSLRIQKAPYYKIPSFVRKSFQFVTLQSALKFSRTGFPCYL